MVNTTYIGNATDFFDRASRFSSETGYMFGHGIVILVAWYAFSRTADRGSDVAALYAGFWSFLTSLVLFLAGLEDSNSVVFTASFTLLMALFIKLSSN